MKLFRQIMARVIFLPLILAAGLAVTAVITVHVMFKPADLAAVVTNQFQEILKRPVRIEWAKLSATGEIKIKGLTATEPGPEAVNFLRAEYIYATYRLLPLLKRKIEIDSVVLVSPEIELIKREDGTWNFGDIFAAYRRKGGRNRLTKMDRAEIKDGELRVTMRASKSSYSLENINVSLKDFKPEGDFPFDASIFLKSDAFKRPVEGRFYAEGTVNLADFDWTWAEVKDLRADLTLLDKTAKFTGGIRDFRRPRITLKAETPSVKSSELAYLFASPVNFTAPRSFWDLDAVFTDSRTIETSVLSRPLNIKAEGVFDLSLSTPEYTLAISAPPMNMGKMAAYGVKLPVENPSGKVQVRIKVGSRAGRPVLSSIFAGTNWAGFKYRNLSVAELEASALLAENFANSHITAVGGKLAMGKDRLTGLKLKTKISKDELAVDYAGRLNGFPIKGLVAIRNPFSASKTVNVTGHSVNMVYADTWNMILNSRQLFAKGRKNGRTYESDLAWLKTLKNSIPSGYASFKLLYKADKFKHDYYAADAFYASASLRNITGDISKMRGDISVKSGAGVFYDVARTSEKDRVFYLFTLPLTFIHRMNRTGALKFGYKVNDIHFNSIGADYSLLEDGRSEIRNFYMDGKEFSAYASGTLDFSKETMNLKIYTMSGKYYSMGSLPEAMTDASGKPALAFILSGKMSNPDFKIISPKDSGRIIKEAAQKGAEIDFGRIDRFAGGKK
ncbi:MAG: AsmA family protein [Elusimicrobiales bacterium]